MSQSLKYPINQLFVIKQLISAAVTAEMVHACMTSIDLKNVSVTLEPPKSMMVLAKVRIVTKLYHYCSYTFCIEFDVNHPHFSYPMWFLIIRGATTSGAKTLKQQLYSHVC